MAVSPAHRFGQIIGEGLEAGILPLIRSNRRQLKDFIAQLERAVSRRIESIRILPLHGTACELPSVEAAVTFVKNYEEAGANQPVVGYEIQIRYNNGDRIDGRFAAKEAAIGFLESYRHR